MTDPALDRYCPVHARRNQDGYNSDLRCNAIVGYEVRIPLLCAAPTVPLPPDRLLPFPPRHPRRVFGPLRRPHTREGR